MGKCSSPLSQAEKWSTRKAEKSVVQSQNESLLPWLKTLSHQFPVFSSCESTLHLNPTFLKFTTWTRKLISSTLASHKCCGHNLEMESSVTHGKNSLSSSANRENISFVVIIAKFQCAVFSRVGLWVCQMFSWVQEMPQVSQGSAVIHQGEKISVPDRLGGFSWSSEIGKPNKLKSVCTQTETLRPKNFISFIFSWYWWSVFSNFPGTKSPELMMDQG